VQFVFGIDDPRRIGKNDLVFAGFIQECLDAVTRSLHFRRYDRHLLPDQCVEQRAFACVGATEYVYKSCFHIIRIGNIRLREVHVFNPVSISGK
jgi:hypothetical protein